MTENSEKAGVRWVRPGRQTRSQKTQESLLDSAEILLFEKGAEATSVADIASHAGCSVGSVYHHFRDKKALLYALHDRMTAQYKMSADRAVDPARREGESITGILAAYIKSAIELKRTRPGFKRAGLEAAHYDFSLREDFADLQAAFYQGLHRLLSARSEDVGHPDPDFACGFVLDQVTAMMRSRSDPLFRKTQVAPCSDQQFMIELIRSACAYLQIPMPDETELPQLKTITK